MALSGGGPRGTETGDAPGGIGAPAFPVAVEGGLAATHAVEGALTFGEDGFRGVGRDDTKSLGFLERFFVLPVPGFAVGADDKPIYLDGGKRLKPESELAKGKDRPFDPGGAVLEYDPVSRRTPQSGQGQGGYGQGRADAIS